MKMSRSRIHIGQVKHRPNDPARHDFSPEEPLRLLIVFDRRNSRLETRRTESSARGKLDADSSSSSCSFVMPGFCRQEARALKNSRTKGEIPFVGNSLGKKPSRDSLRLFPRIYSRRVVPALHCCIPGFRALIPRKSGERETTAGRLLGWQRGRNEWDAPVGKPGQDRAESHENFR